MRIEIDAPIHDMIFLQYPRLLRNTWPDVINACASIPLHPHRKTLACVSLGPYGTLQSALTETLRETLAAIAAILIGCANSAVGTVSSMALEGDMLSWAKTLPTAAPPGLRDSANRIAIKRYIVTRPFEEYTDQGHVLLVSRGRTMKSK